MDRKENLNETSENNNDAVKEDITSKEDKKKSKDKKSSIDYEKRFNELLCKVEELEKDKKILNDSLLRRAAEFENYKRRTEGELDSYLKFAAENFIKKIIPIYNDFGRSLAHANEQSNKESFINGLKLLFVNFTKTLEEQGVKKIDCVGKEFDFNLHEALLQQPSKDFPPHTVMQEVEPGYTYKDKIILHARVIVSQEVPESDENSKNENLEA